MRAFHLFVVILLFIQQQQQKHLAIHKTYSWDNITTAAGKWEHHV
jgi:hypothetical protein